MSRRTATRLAWSLFALCIVLSITSIVLFALAHVTRIKDVNGSELITGLGLIVFPAVGVLVASRRPENPIGWLLLLVGVIGAVTSFADGYALYGVVARPGSLPATDAVTVLALLSGSALVFTLIGTFLLLLFPDGRLPSRRWRPVAWLCGVVIGVLLVDAVFQPGPIEGLRAVDNPIGLSGRAGSAIEAAGGLLFVPLVLCILASAISLIVRFRRSTGLERQQLKWIAAAGGLLAGWLVSGPLFFWWVPFGGVWDALLPVTVVAFPISFGFAILRYRLYDLGRIVNRTVVYLAVTALLAALYFGIVIGLQQVFGTFTRGNDLAIAGSTLAVAALFRPARRRIQGFVDRRFYRRRYDAQQTLEAFSARLRDEIDLEALGQELRAVVHETMRPAHVSLWLRPHGEER